MQRRRAHFFPLHWLQCHLRGSIYSDFFKTSLLCLFLLVSYSKVPPLHGHANLGPRPGPGAVRPVAAPVRGVSKEDWGGSSRGENACGEGGIL